MRVEAIFPFRLPDALARLAPDDYYQTALALMAEKRIPESQLPGSTAASHERKEEFAALIAFSVQWIQENLGLDVSACVPSLEDIYFFPEEEWRTFCWEVLKIWSEEAKGYICKSGRQIFLLERTGKNKEQWEDRGFHHEIVHAFARTLLVRDTEENQLKIYHSGFHHYDNGSFYALTEGITELLNQEILSAYHSRWSRTQAGHHQLAMTMLVGWMTTKLAQKLGETPRQTRHELYHAYLTGDYRALRIFERTFGSGTLAALKDIPASNVRRSELKPLFKRFGLSSAVWKAYVDYFYDVRDRRSIMELVETIDS